MTATLTNALDRQPLDRYYILRLNLAEVKKQLEQATPAAIAVAEAVVEESSKKTFPWGLPDSGHSFQISYRAPKVDGDPTLQQLAKDIAAKNQAVCDANAVEIADVEGQIAVLQAKLGQLKKSPEAAPLQAQYDTRKKELSVKKVPTLSLKGL